MTEKVLWVEKYRPATIDECVLPANIKKMFNQFVTKGESPNLLLSGGPGVGKTTIAKAMLEQMGCTYMVINASMYGNIDVLRTDIKRFATTMSLTGGRKYVILDEADYLNPQSTQPALRNFIEEFSDNCGFILTCNYPAKILKELRSRCTEVEFKVGGPDKMKLAKEFFETVKNILAAEHVEYDPKVVSALIVRYFPDFRRVLNELQGYSAVGLIDTGILTQVDDIAFEQLITHLHKRDFDGMRKWVAGNAAGDSTELFRRLFDTAVKYVEPTAIPQLVVTIGEYQYKAAFVADLEINTVACMTELMSDVAFKKVGA